MKKFALLILLLLMPLVIKAEEYDVQSANLKVIFPDDWYVFTRENVKDNEKLKELNVSEDYMNNFFVKNNAYFDALETDIEFVLRIGEKVDFNSMSDYPDEKVLEYATDLGAINHTDDYKVYTNKYKYTIIKYTYQSYNILMYSTVINGRWYNYTAQKQSEFTAEEANEIKKIVDTIEYTIIEQDPEEIEAEKEKIEESNKNSKLKMILAYAFIVIIIVTAFLHFFLLKKKK